MCATHSICFYCNLTALNNLICYPVGISHPTRFLEDLCVKHAKDDMFYYKKDVLGQQH